MRRLILGTAGHIDHGKTALVRALTGVDTDRLAEEKARGITIDLGFAELAHGEVRFGVVDVPGHEGFVRNMLAGAAGMDVVVLVVAADEGVMPQTREHLAIVELLGVTRLVVAVTKADLAEPEWLELVEEEVRDVLAGTPYAEAPMVRTSATTGEGLDRLTALLVESGQGAGPRTAADLLFLPLDRVFTIRGTGTVVTGTVWSGTVSLGDRLRILPGGGRARVRGLQVHDREAREAGPGSRTALALTGEATGADELFRGQALVDLEAWSETRMLTVRVRVLADAAKPLQHGQRVRLHLGTAEVMARFAALGAQDLAPGEAGWGQLRLEAPVVARAGHRFVLRTYSPVQTFAGGEVVEPLPPKRKRLDKSQVSALEALRGRGSDDASRMAAALELAGPLGCAEDLLPVATGLAPERVATATPALPGAGALATEGVWFGARVVGGVEDRILAEIDRVHREEPFRAGAPVESLRALVAEPVPATLADAVLARQEDSGRVTVSRGHAARVGFEPRLSPEQEALREELMSTLAEAGLAPPALDELPDGLRSDPAFVSILRGLEAEGRIVALTPELFVWREAVDEAIERVRAHLAGQGGLGPADFKEVVPVSRKYLLPLLGYFDRCGVTENRGDERRVAPVS